MQASPIAITRREEAKGGGMPTVFGGRQNFQVVDVIVSLPPVLVIDGQPPGDGPDPRFIDETMNRPVMLSAAAQADAHALIAAVIEPWAEHLAPAVTDEPCTRHFVRPMRVSAPFDPFAFPEGV